METPYAKQQDDATVPGKNLMIDTAISPPSSTTTTTSSSATTKSVNGTTTTTRVAIAVDLLLMDHSEKKPSALNGISDETWHELVGQTMEMDLQHRRWSFFQFLVFVCVGFFVLSIVTAAGGAVTPPIWFAHLLNVIWVGLAFWWTQQGMQWRRLRQICHALKHDLLRQGYTIKVKKEKGTLLTCCNESMFFVFQPIDNNNDDNNNNNNDNKNSAREVLV